MDLNKHIEPIIIAQNQEFSVINKPIGWTIQRDENAPDVLSWLRHHLNIPVYPVHRLDKPTSGLLLVAHTEIGNKTLSMAFAQRRIQKTYWAVSDQKPKKKQGWVKGDMDKSRRGQFKLLRSQENPAITQFSSFSLEQGMRGFVLKPSTGKTHQLRVAMKSLGAPILGDEMYGGSLADRMYLHAAELQFEWQGNSLHFVAPAKEHWFIAMQNSVQ